jgi:hypothetical protein
MILEIFGSLSLLVSDTAAVYHAHVRNAVLAMRVLPGQPLSLTVTDLPGSVQPAA